MKKTIRNLVIIIYAIIAIFVTICLLSYNDYKVSEFGNNSLVIVNNHDLEPDYANGELLIINNGGEIKIGDNIFFYNNYSKTTSVSLAKITAEEIISDTEKFYTLEGDKSVSSKYLIGKSDETTAISNIGAVLGLLESKWGFLLLIVLPALLALLYEIFEVVSEVKNGSKNEEKEKTKQK